MANEIIRGKLLSPDGKLALMVLALEPAATGPDRLSGIVGTVRKELADPSGRHRPQGRIVRRAGDAA